jgi:Domain of unknown function (DUF4760)
MLGKLTLNVQLSIDWLRLIILLGLLSIVAYVLLPNSQSDLGYAVAVLGGIGILITAINDIEVRKEALQQNKEALQQNKLKAALDFVHEWNNPLFFHAKSNGRETLRKFKEKGETDQEFLKAKPDHLGNLIDIMNFLELLSVSIQMGESDEPAIKRFFRGILIEYWQHAEHWVRGRRAEKTNPRLFCEAEWLYDRWKS